MVVISAMTKAVVACERGLTHLMLPPICFRMINLFSESGMYFRLIELLLWEHGINLSSVYHLFTDQESGISVQ